MRFGDFTLDLAAGEVQRNGTRIKLQDLPFRLLVELASRPGEVVTREELRAKLWGAETFVDAEAGLNTAIAKVREALGDRAEAPIFIATVPRRGYRFLVAVQATRSESATPAKRPISRGVLGWVVLCVILGGIVGNAPILRTPRIFTDIQRIGEALSVRYVLIAQLQRPESGLAVRLHFIRTSDQAHLWATEVSGTPAGLETRVAKVVVARVRESVLAAR